MKLPKLLATTRNGEVASVSGRISSDYHQTKEGDAVLNPLFLEIDALNQSLTAATKRMKAESDLELKDELRDTAHHALFYYLYGLSLGTNPATKAPAVQLMTILNHYGMAITKENYDQESADMDSLLLDLESEESLAAIGLLHECATLVLGLQNTHDAFKAARLAFQQEQAAEGQLESASSLKSQMIKLINDKLIPVLGGLMVSNPAAYTDFAAMVAKVINTNNETVQQRKTATPEPVENN